MLPMKRGRAAFWLGAIVITATVARLALGAVYFGFHTGDDVGILQAGFMRALGWPYQPWEIRNLLVADLLTGPAIALASALGASSTRTLIWLASVPMVVFASLNVWLVYRLAVRWLASEPAGLLASALYACHWLPLGYGSMVYPRTVSTTCVLVAALVLWDRRGGPAGRPFLAGGCLAVAWALRYSEAIFLLPLLTLIGLQEKDRAARSSSSCRSPSSRSFITRSSGIFKASCRSSSSWPRRGRGRSGRAVGGGGRPCWRRSPSSWASAVLLFRGPAAGVSSIRGRLRNVHAAPAFPLHSSSRGRVRGTATGAREIPSRGGQAR
jgi:hypothetical protein